MAGRSGEFGRGVHFNLRVMCFALVVAGSGKAEGTDVPSALGRICLRGRDGLGESLTATKLQFTGAVPPKGRPSDGAWICLVNLFSIIACGCQGTLQFPQKRGDCFLRLINGVFARSGYVRYSGDRATGRFRAWTVGAEGHYGLWANH